MKGEKQGVSAWLRGIIGECGVSGTRSCTAIAEAFGIDCEHEKTCRVVEDEEGRTACSECGCTALYMLDASYCPNCGAEVVE